MGIAIVIMLQLAIAALAIIVPIIARMLINLDYVFLLLVIWAFVFGASGYNENGLLSNYDIHTVFTILIYLAALGIWFGLQQIKVFDIYVFRIVACALSAYIFTYMVSTGFLGQTIANSMDTIWKWTVGIVYFIIVVVLRVRDESLMNHDKPYGHND